MVNVVPPGHIPLLPVLYLLRGKMRLAALLVFFLFFLLVTKQSLYYVNNNTSNNHTRM